MAAFGMPKSNDAEKAARKAAIDAATVYAIKNSVPYYGAGLSVIRSCKGYGRKKAIPIAPVMPVWEPYVPGLRERHLPECYDQCQRPER